MAERVSGEALRSNAHSLLRTLEGQLGSRREAEIRALLPLWRRDANMRQPPRQQAAAAVSWRTLKRLVARAQGARLSRSERQALDIFVLAFATVSRVGEIAALEVEHVAPDGGHLTLRPKTGARTWRRLVKRVANTPSLRAADMLWRRREEARRGGFRFVFRSGGDKPPSTASSTGHLRDVTRRLGIPARVTAHSARKGAAVEALLAGTPLPVIQALGGWRDINTLQAYIGEAVRRTTSLLHNLEGTGRGTGHTPCIKGEVPSVRWEGEP